MVDDDEVEAGRKPLVAGSLEAAVDSIKLTTKTKL